MNKTSKLLKVYKTAKKFANNKSPEILMGIGIAGMITTVVLAVKATPKALEKIEEKKREVYDELDPSEVPTQGLPEDVKLKPSEVIKVSWKEYVPTIVTGTLSTACLIGSNKASTKRHAALLTAYNLSQTALTEYKDKVIETIGEKKEQKVREAIAEDRIKKDPVSSPTAQTIFVTGNGEERFYDAIGERRFTSSIISIREALVKLNNRLRDEMVISLNDFYNEVGLNDVPYGDSLGWYVNKCREIEPEFSSFIDDDAKACIVVDFLVRPDYDYNEWK